MKTDINLQEIYNRLATENISIRQLARELNLPESTLRTRLKKQFGPDYLDRIKGEVGSLLHVLRHDILSDFSEVEKATFEFDKWIKENIAALTSDQNLLSDSQLDRLTRSEVCKKYSLDEMLNYSTFLEERITEGFTLVPVAPQFHIVTQVSPPESRPYINQDDLQEVLSDYYAGCLNDCDPYLDRLYLDDYQLHPSNSLWSLIDEDTFNRCLSKLSIEQQTVLRFEYAPPSLETEAVFYTHFYLSDINDVQQYKSLLLIDSLTAISDELIKLI